ncbi:MAG: LysR family transcriptional regulator [Planctomycetaceae bacterium]|nr:LysR family transcriptional regulator [Planctomycetaceae bacterium]
MFCDAVEWRSISRAAEAQGVTQSAVSQAIQQLEKRLDLQLIDRSTRPFELTAAGRVYFEGCRTLLNSYREIEDQVKGLVHRVSGRVRIAAIYSVSLIQINETIARFRSEYPDVDVVIDFDHPAAVYQRVEEERDDIGLVSFPKSKGVFECHHWQDQPMVLVVGPQHPWYQRSQLQPAEVNGVRFVGLSPNLLIRKTIDKWFREVGISVETVHEFDNIECVKRDVESGTLAALLPEPTVRDECERGRLRSLELVGTNWSRPLGIIHRKGRELSAATRKLMDVLLDECRDDLSGRSSSTAAAGRSTES